MKPIPDNLPNWTVGFNWMPMNSETPPGVPYPRNSWVGTGRLFFDDEWAASEWYERLIAMGLVPFKRRFEAGDVRFLGACHRQTSLVEHTDDAEREDS